MTHSVQHTQHREHLRSTISHGILLYVPLRWNLPKDQIGGDWKHLLSLKDRDQHGRGRRGYDQTRIYFIGGEDSEAREQGHDS